MWGIASILFVGALGLVLLAIALTAGWGLPVIAVAIVVLVAPIAIALNSRESGEPGSESAAQAGQGAAGGKPSWLRKHWWE